MSDPGTTANDKGWSAEGRAWLIYWIVLFVISAALPFWEPDFLYIRLKKGLTIKELLVGTVFLLGWGMAGYFCFTWLQKTRRRKALAAICPQLGLSFQPEPLDIEWEPLTVFSFFQIGYEHETRNLMAGKVADWNVTLIDHFFRRSIKTKKDIDPKDRDAGVKAVEKAFKASGQESRSYHQTVAAFWNVGKGMPDFQLVARESWWTSHTANHRTPKALLVDLNIGKEQNPQFAKVYKIGGQDEETIRRFFSPVLLNALAQQQGWDIETARGHVLVYQEGRLQSPHQLAAFLEGAAQVVKTLRGEAAS